MGRVPSTTCPFLDTPVRWLGAALVLFLLSLTAPLPTYTVSLALFGLPHVFAELRYVDRRFTARLERRHVAAFLVPPFAICGLRLAHVASSGRLGGSPALELGLAAVMVLATVPILRGRSPGFFLLAAGTTAGLSWLAVEAPVAALVTFAFAHNVTPVLFLMERLEGEERRRFLRGPALVSFLLLPALLATGCLAPLATTGWRAALDRDLLGAGALETHLGVFVPAFLGAGDGALHLFQAAAMLQGLHYLYVLRVLPRTVSSGTPRTLVAWPEPRAFAGALVALCALGLTLFWVAFAPTRAVYGVFAAFHAWVEWPLLLVGLAGVSSVLARPAHAELPRA